MYQQIHHLTKLLLFGGLLAFKRHSLAIGQGDENEIQETCAATTSHFNLVVEPQFGGNKRCMDGDAKCPAWSQAGECMRNPVFMLAVCMTSCRSCLSVTRSYGVEQVVSFGTQSDVLEEYMVTQRMHDYMIDVVFQDSSLRNVKDTVRNPSKRKHVDSNQILASSHPRLVPQPRQGLCSLGSNRRMP